MNTKRNGNRDEMAEMVEWVKRAKGEAATRAEVESDAATMEALLDWVANKELTRDVAASRYGQGVVSDMGLWNAHRVAPELGSTWMERVQARAGARRLEDDVKRRLTQSARNMVALLKRRRARVLAVLS